MSDESIYVERKDRPANGESLVKMATMLKQYVLQKIGEIDPNFDKTALTSMINEILSDVNIPTDETIRGIVDSAIEESGSVNSDQVTTIINNMIMTGDLLSEDDVTTIVSNAISSIESITEERVQEMIDESVGSVIAAAY